MNNKKLSFFRLFSIYTFWFAFNTVITTCSWFIMNFILSNQYSFSFLLFVILILECLLGYFIGKMKATKRSDWILIYSNLVVFVLLSTFIQPTALNEWISLLFIVSITCPFLMQLKEMLIDCKVLKDLASDASNNAINITKEIHKNKK